MRSLCLIALSIYLSSLCYGFGADDPEPQLSPGTDGQPTVPAGASSEPVTLQFRDQEWLPILKWLAGELNLNLDWQQIPEGNVNIFTTGPCDLAHAEDLINMQLLARGFTLLKRDEILRVVTLKDIDITLVPHIEPSELSSRNPHDFVRVSFSLEWMIAEDAAKEFQPLLSPYGKLFPIASANRLEAMDAVINLLELNRLLFRAEKDDVRRERVAEFKLQHRKAEEIVPKVRQLVGLPPEGQPSSSSQTQLDIEQARFKAEAVKQMGSNAKELLADKKPTIFVTVNEKENSILVNAPPNKIEVVRQAITALDRPLPESISPWETMSRVKVYEVNGFDPDTLSRLLASLQEQGNLAKTTRIQHEAAFHRLVVFASPEDQVAIGQIVDSFRVQKRSPAVIPLGGLDPIYAVKAIQLILKNPERATASASAGADGKFQVEADPENQRLLLWATAEEVAEVSQFLESLGEGDRLGQRDGRMHVVNLNGKSLAELEPILKKVWSQVSDVPVVVESTKSNIEDDASSWNDQSTPDVDGSTTQPADRERLQHLTDVVAARFVSSPLNSQEEDTKSSNASQPILRILESEHGEALLLSRDSSAVDSAKMILEHLTKSRSQVRAIALKHAQASLVKQQLDAILLPTLVQHTSKLSTTQPLRIDVDARTNRLLIHHATARQLERIEEFVPLIDQPNHDDERLKREVVSYRFRHRRATEVIDVVKDVFRDLLSMNDRIFQASNSNRMQGYNRNLAATTANPEYQGLLAVGVDREANSLTISAPAYIIEEVLALVRSIDTPEDGPAVAIVPFSSNMMKSRRNETLLKILTEGKK